MTSTIKVNNIQNQCGQNIINENSNTITIGASGDTIALASGASQSGFGRAGSVNWQTGSIKTGNFTAADGEGYFVDTSSGAVTASLPAGSAGAIVAFADYTRTFQTHNLTVSPNGSEKIGGVAENLTLNIEGQALTLVYVDGTEGWINVQNAEDTETGTPPFIQATGGTITTSGDCKIHTFTGPGTFAVSSLSTTPANNAVGYLVVAGGGGGSGGPSGDGGGGGGAGGFREGRNNPITPYTASPLVTCGHTVSVQSYPITVGAAGTGTGTYRVVGGSGGTSTFSSFTSAGGGGGGANTTAAAAGGSGGGGGAGGGGPFAGANGNTPPVSPAQGSNGGSGANPGGTDQKGGGGGGATAVGQNGQPPQTGGAGGAGATTHITGSPTAYAGGGGGMSSPASPGPAVAAGGTGGGGAGNSGGVAATAGTTNTGGGGGGSGNSPSPDSGANGGSGIVIIRYKFQ